MSGAITLLTRHKEGNRRLNARLKIPTVSYDLYDVSYEAIPPQAAFTSYILTSRHAANAAVKNGIQHATFYVVGEEAKAIVTQAALGEVAHCAEQVDVLIDYLSTSRPPTLTYLRGEVIRENLINRLAPYGISVSEVLAYKIKKNTSEQRALYSFLTSNELPLIVPLLSVQTARFLADLLFSHACITQIPLHAVAISDTVLNAVAEYQWASLSISKKRNLSSIAEACTNRYDGIST